MNQIIGDIYVHDQGNKLFISTGDIDQDTAANLLKFLKIKIKIVGSYCSKPGILTFHNFTYVIY